MMYMFFQWFTDIIIRKETIRYMDMYNTLVTSVSGVLELCLLLNDSQGTVFSNCYQCDYPCRWDP